MFFGAASLLLKPEAEGAEPEQYRKCELKPMHLQKPIYSKSVLCLYHIYIYMY